MRVLALVLTLAACAPEARLASGSYVPVGNPVLGVEAVNLNLELGMAFLVLADGREERGVTTVDPERWPDGCTDDRPKGVAQEVLDLELPELALDGVTFAGAQLQAACELEGGLWLQGSDALLLFEPM